MEEEIEQLKRETDCDQDPFSWRRSPGDSTSIYLLKEGLWASKLRAFDDFLLS